jgi:hypothetical protein
VAASAAAISLVAAVDALKATAKAASSHVQKVVSKVALKTVSKAVKTTTVLMTVVVTRSSHVKARLAVTLAKAKAHHVATSVPHVALKTAHLAALMTVPQHVAHVPRLKQVVHRSTSQLVQLLASRLVAVLTLRNAHLSHAHRVN